jgi:beta-lactamase superfamily II metal-dependent hydrolase
MLGISGNSSSQPSPSILDALQGYPLLRTDQNGWIELTTDGSQMWMEVERR